MCMTVWEVWVAETPESYWERDYDGTPDDLPHWPVGATIKTGRVTYYPEADARALACQAARELAAAHPELADRIFAGRVFWCSGEEIEQALGHEEWEAATETRA